MNKLIIPVCMVFIFAFFIIPVNANIPDNHKQVICFTCHGVVGDEEDECGNCHNYVGGNRVIQSLMESQHNPGICKICHGVKDRNTYHLTHVNVSCNTCHESGNALPVSKITDCAGCHGGQIHNIHQDRIASICSDCHSSRPASNPASVPVISNNKITAGIYAKVINYKQFTLYEVFRKILSSFSFLYYSL
ncbi:MAG: hypothetical protein SCH70_12850 [Candidatus Methanoperedens sp.]|nr:hypothetical protein [Candidatus Methanoperedens sp.]